jgi:hypothetical protein
MNELKILIFGLYNKPQTRFWRIFYKVWCEPITADGQALKKARLCGVKVRITKGEYHWWKFSPIVK